MTSSPSQSTTLSDHQVISSGLDFAGVTRFLQQDAANPETQSLRLSISALVERTAHVRRTQESFHRHHRAPGRQAVAPDTPASVAADRHGLGLAWPVRIRRLPAGGAVAAPGAGGLARRCAGAARRSRQILRNFERLAWRTLGEALLVLDLYEQQSTAPQRAAPPSTPPRPSRPTLLARLRAWLGDSACSTAATPRHVAVPQTMLH